MSKEKDQTTDGKGKVEEKAKAGAPADDADLKKGSETPADNEGGNEEETSSTDSDEEIDLDLLDESEPNKSTESDSDEDEDGDADPLPGDDGEKKFTQTEANAFVQKRLSDQKKSLTGKFKKELEARDTTISNLKKQLGTYLKSDKEALQTELDALPEAIREMAPGKLETAKGIAAVKRWMPKAKKLAENLGGVKVPGNRTDFRPNAPGKGESDDEVAKKAKKHSIYSSF
jgi:hypothetical protein